jgi:hypothetical protein
VPPFAVIACCDCQEGFAAGIARGSSASALDFRISLRLWRECNSLSRDISQPPKVDFPSRIVIPHDQNIYRGSPLSFPIVEPACPELSKGILPAFLNLPFSTWRGHLARDFARPMRRRSVVGALLAAPSSLCLRL